MSVPHLNIKISENELEKGAELVLKEIRPDWNDSDVTFKVFTDGITNKLMGCFNKTDADNVLLIRVYGNKTDMLIDRQAETRNFKLLHSYNLAPKLYATLNNGLVYEYLDGVTLDTKTCVSVDIYPSVAKRLAEMHCVTSGTDVIPNMWTKLLQFYNLVPEVLSDLTKESRRDKSVTSKSLFYTEIMFLKEELSKLGSRVVFCHNDLLLANVIHNNKDNTVKFIDYEYAEYNYQAFDIANHFCEFAGVDTVDYSLYPSADFQKTWLENYWSQFKNVYKFKDEQLLSDSEEINKLYKQVEKFSLASHMFWGVWSMIQAEHSYIDFDFVEYSAIRMREYFNQKSKVFS